jgi:hypothetical protein
MTAPRKPRALNPEMRFWSKADKSGMCWLWQWAVCKDGYGRFQLNEGGRQRHVRAHRYAFFLEHGREPMGLVLHSCDTAACVNPAHLSEGNQLVNVRDCVARGRHRAGRKIGSAHPRAKSTEADLEARRTGSLPGDAWWRLRATEQKFSTLMSGSFWHVDFKFQREEVAVSFANAGKPRVRLDSAPDWFFPYAGFKP